VFVLSSTECDFQKNWRITIEDVLLQLLKLKCITLFTVNGRKNRKKYKKCTPILLHALEVCQLLG